MIPEIDTKEFSEFVKPYVTGEKKVDTNCKAVQHAMSIELHAEGEASNPKLRELLDRRRPNESAAVKQHRLANFRPITKSEFERVENTLHIIFNPRNYSIKWPEMAVLKKDTTFEYFTENFPKYGSLMTYFEQSLFHNILIDPNGFVLMLPYVEDSEQPGLVKPFPYFIESEEIIEQTDEYYVICQDSNFILFDKAVVITGVFKGEKEGKKIYEWQVIYEHELGQFPIVEMPGVEKDNDSIFGEKLVKESYVAGILPYWDKALMADTDRDAVQVRFAHPKEWEWKSNCKECGGIGKIAMAGLKSNGFRICGSCHGSGSTIGDSPADKFRVDPKYMADNGIAPPPFGFVSPAADILDHIKLTVRENINDGFGALNMQHLAIDNTGESGTAKIVGRKDLNTFMLKVSNGVWDTYKEIVKVISELRYGPSGQFNENEMPDIARPVEFDIYTSDELTSKVAAAKTAGMDASYVKLLQIQTAKKDFGEESAEALFFVALQEIDPFPNSTADDLLTFQSNLKKSDQIVHANINNLMNIAIAENKDFLYMERSKQREIVYALADEMAKELDKQKAMIPTPPPLGNDPGATF